MVREGRPQVPGTDHPPGKPSAIKWYAGADGNPVVYSGTGQKQIFDSQLWVKQTAEGGASSGDDE